MTLYFGSCSPCCSAMQKRGDITVRRMSDCVTGSGLVSHPFSRSFHEIPHHLFLMVWFVVLVMARMMLRLLRRRPPWRLSNFLVDGVALVAMAFGFAIVPVISMPLAKSPGRGLSE